MVSSRGPRVRKAARAPEPRKPTYQELLSQTGRVAPVEDPGRYFALAQESSTAAAVRQVAGLTLRSVLRIDSVEGAKNPDCIVDQLHTTMDIKNPSSIKHSAWGKLLGDAISKSDGAVFDVRSLQIDEEQAQSTISRALGSHQRGRRIDHVLVIGETEGRTWHFWGKGGPS